MGAIPTGDKVVVVGLGSEILGCKVAIKMVQYLFQDCRRLCDSVIRLCNWIDKVYGVRVPKL